MEKKWKKVVPYLLTAAVTVCICVAVVAVILRPQPLQVGTVDLGTVEDASISAYVRTSCSLLWYRLK